MSHPRYKLPGLAGLDIIAHLRVMANDDIPVIVITGQDDPVLKEHLLTAGVSGYIEKPFVPETLVIIVEDILSR
jgi:DNA-binding response OmpR family regulator